MMRGIVLISAALLLLTSCGAPQLGDFGNQPPIGTAIAQDLKGTWNFWMRHETNPNVSLVRATMVIQEQFCDVGVCRIAGMILKPQVATAGTQLSFSGIYLPDLELIRLQYFDRNTSSEPLIVVVELDIFLKNFSPERTMVGYFSIFDQNDPGAANEDSTMLLASGRGQLLMSGRVTAWPVIIQDPTRP